MSRVVYAFELRGIQRYLFNTGRLKDMILASELIDFVFEEPLDEALKLVGLDLNKPQPRRAGGAAYLVMDTKEQAERLRDVWSLTILQLLPGIELVDAIATGGNVKEAISSALQKLQVARNQAMPQLPMATPLTALTPRTGEPAVSIEGAESLDISTLTRRKAKRSKGGLVDHFGDSHLKWPNNFEEDSHDSRRFRLNADNFVGMLHLDGNGIGVILRILNHAASSLNDDDYIAAYQAFSTGLGNITRQAAKLATQDILVPAISESGVIPARPLVLGGDDLTILLRSDLALPFAQAYAQHFEVLSVGFIKDLKQLLKTDEFPDSLSVSGGLVLIKPSFPFSQAFSLTEGFASRAKQLATYDGDKKCSTISLYRVQGAVGDDAEALFEREQVVTSNQEANVHLSLQAYGLSNEGSAQLPKLQSLLDLVRVCLKPEFSKARLRSLLSLMHQNLNLAKDEYARWGELMRKNTATSHTWKGFESTLAQLLGEVDKALPCAQQQEDLPYRSSPLNDLLILIETQMVSPLNTQKEVPQDAE